MTSRCSRFRFPLPRPLLAFVSVALSASVVLAAPLEKLTIERINAEPALAGTLPSRFQWHPDGKRLTFQRRGNGASTSKATEAPPRGVMTRRVRGPGAAEASMATSTNR